jgi:hypothetical protein
MNRNLTDIYVTSMFLFLPVLLFLKLEKNNNSDIVANTV